MESSVVILFGYENQIYGLARQPATECPCEAGPDLDHRDICPEASETTIDLDNPITHFASDPSLSVDELIALAIIELEAVAVDRKKAN